MSHVDKMSKAAFCCFHVMQCLFRHAVMEPIGRTFLMRCYAEFGKREVFVPVGLLYIFKHTLRWLHDECI